MSFDDFICFEHSDEDPLADLIELLDNQIVDIDCPLNNLVDMQEFEMVKECEEEHARA